MPESRFTEGDRGGREDRRAKDDYLSPISEEYVEELNRMIPVAGVDSPGGAPTYADQKRQLDLILASKSFRSAPLLQKSLQFITAESSQGRHEELSEYIIATQVFGRPANFDPLTDTIVRTQAYRLRIKLKEYYGNEGKSEKVIVEVPKGRYVPRFSFRQEPKEEPVRGESGETTAPDDEKPPSPWFKGRPGAILIAGVALAVVLGFAVGALVGWRSSVVSRKRIATANVPEPVAQFWQQFIGDREIILAYTNAVFLITDTADLLRFRNSGAIADRGAVAGKDVAQSETINPALAARAGTLYYEEGLTGTGEVLATYRLASLLTQLGAKAQVKRSRLVTVDDFRDHDVIFLGSPFENEVLAEMHFSRRFSFEQPETPPLLWRGRIVDRKVPTSDVSYGIERDPQSQVIRADYALFDVLPGPAPGRRIMVLAGITTSGTQGAAEFATSDEGLRQILGLEGTPQGNNRVYAFPRYFESLLRVETARGMEAVNVKFVDGSVVPVQR